MSVSGLVVGRHGRSAAAVRREREVLQRRHNAPPWNLLCFSPSRTWQARREHSRAGPGRIGEESRIEARQYNAGKEGRCPRARLLSHSSGARSECARSIGPTSAFLAETAANKSRPMRCFITGHGSACLSLQLWRGRVGEGRRILDDPSGGGSSWSSSPGLSVA